MSQKRKQRRRYQRRASELAATVAPTNSPPTVIVSTETLGQSVTNNRPSAAAASTATETSDGQLLRRDLVKVAIVVGIVIGGLVTMVVTNDATGWLDRIADQIYQWLKLG